MQTNPTDPPIGYQYALQGRVVIMDANFTVLDQGTVFIDTGQIVAVTPAGMPAPTAYENVPVFQTNGTIYPGLIELHNHPRYNFLQLWQVPQLYTNRSQWIGTPEYRKWISGPLDVLDATPGYIEAIIRYVECKLLLSGVTSSQGIALIAKDGSLSYYSGIVRSVEQTGEADLPQAVSHLADVQAVDSAQFLARLQSCSCMLLHLSEGTDDQARAHFTALQMSDATWAITPALAGIHSLALTPGDFQTLQSYSGAMVWSPLSNLLLYGKTADVGAAKRLGIRIAIGADWSPSGSKNLLGELKVARLYSQANGNLFTDQELLSMATLHAAQILQWDHVLGSIEAGKHADLLIVAGEGDDPYAALLQAHETDINLVIINGVPRYGNAELMAHFGPGTESWQVGQVVRTLNLAQEIPDPIVGDLTLQDAYARLKDGLQRLPELASALENASTPAASPRWSLNVDETAMRPFLKQGMAGLEAAREQLQAADTIPLSQILVPLDLDALTVADDTTFLSRLMMQQNLPDYIKQGLSTL